MEYYQIQKIPQSSGSLPAPQNSDMAVAKIKNNKTPVFLNCVLTKKHYFLFCVSNFDTKTYQNMLNVLSTSVVVIVLKLPEKKNVYIRIIH